MKNLATQREKASKRKFQLRARARVRESDKTSTKIIRQRRKKHDISTNLGFIVVSASLRDMALRGLFITIFCNLQSCAAESNSSFMACRSNLTI